MNGLEQLIENFPIENRFDLVWEKISRKKLREDANPSKVKISVGEASDAQPQKFSPMATIVSKEKTPLKK